MQWKLLYYIGIISGEWKIKMETTVLYRGYIGLILG